MNALTEFIRLPCIQRQNARHRDASDYRHGNGKRNGASVVIITAAKSSGLSCRVVGLGRRYSRAGGVGCGGRARRGRSRGGRCGG